MGLIAGQGGPGLMLAPQPPTSPSTVSSPLPVQSPVSSPQSPPVSSLSTESPGESPADESPPVSPGESSPDESQSPTSLRNELLAQLKSKEQEVKYYYVDLDDEYEFYEEDGKIKIKRKNEKPIVAKDFNDKETSILEGAEVIAVLTVKIKWVEHQMKKKNK